MAKQRHWSRQYVDVVASAPRLVVLMLAAVSALCCYPASRFVPATQNVYSSVPGSPSEIARGMYLEAFGHEPPENDVILVQGIPGSGQDLVTSGVLGSVAADVESFVSQRGLVAQVMSYPGLVNQNLSNIASTLLSADKMSGLVILRRLGLAINKTMGLAELDLSQQLKRKYWSATVPFVSYIGVAGVAPFVVEGVKATSRDMARSNPITIPLCLAVLAFTLQSWRFLLITLTNLFVANTISFAIMDVLIETCGIVMSTTVPMTSEACLVALTFDYTLFLLIRFQEEIALGTSLQSAVAASVRRSGHIILGSGFTLCFCSLAYLIFPLVETRTMSAGFLICIATVMTVNLLATPAMLLGFPDFFVPSMPSVERFELQDQQHSSGEQRGAVMAFFKACSSSPTPRGQSSDWEDDSDDSSEDEEDLYLASSSPQRIHLRAQARLRRYQQVDASTSEAWKRWARLCTSPPCSLAMGIAVLVCAILATVGPNAIHLDASQVTEDFALCGPDGSETMQTLSRVGAQFSAGFIGPTTLLFMAKPSATTAAGTSMFDGSLWASANALLLRINQLLMSQGRGGSTVSAFYLSDPGKGQISVTNSMGKAADAGEHLTFATAEQMLELKYVIDQTMNAERTAAMAILTPNLRTTSKAAMQWTNELRALLATQNADPLSPIQVFESSQTGQMMDVEDGVFARMPLVVSVTLVGCIVMVGIIFRSIPCALRSIMTIAFTLAVVYTMAHRVFVLGMLRDFGIPAPGLFFMVPVMTFAIVLGLALDYDIFLLGRMLELRERGLESLEAVTDGVAQTGPVITSAGIMMAIAFGGICMSEVTAMRQMSMIFVFAVLLDTFVVRTAVTPALTAALGDLNWWPRQFKSRAI
eukprot:TRINITY_DN42808_c0_g1_i1.p1 TRINITY_DN42808_c0_g1~~TRINITY_DN42808_c0_g1_i1.p1  ORF type:complete len:873 (-),score=128.63 TRINITY_DN42808_c0_g1_i1:125-2743(-)